MLRASQRSFRAFIELALRDLEQALVCLNGEDAEPSPSLLRAATRLTDLAADRIEVAEQALRELGPDVPLIAVGIPSSRGVRRSVF